MNTRPQEAASSHPELLRQQKLTELILYIINQPDDWIDGALAEVREQRRLASPIAPVRKQRRATLQIVPTE